MSDSEIQRRVITAAKTTEERGWLCEVPSVALVQSVNDSRRAWRNFFDSAAGKRKGRRVGRPRMKSRKDHRQSFRLTRNGFAVRTTAGCLWPRSARSGFAGRAICQRNRRRSDHPRARWALLRQFRRRRRGDTAAGGGPRGRGGCGLARLATIAASDGLRLDVANPKYLGRKLRKLRRLEREKSRRQKGSNNRDKTRRKVASRTRGGPGTAGLSP